MLRATGQQLVLVAAAACAAIAASAADSTTIVSPVYRLNVVNPDQFRLARQDGYAPVPGPVKEEAILAKKLAAKPFAAEIQSAARRAALDPALVHALIHVESRYNPAARSPKGALGLMQVLPETASRYGVANPMRSIDENLRAGTLYLRDLIELFDRRIELALAAYNAGENAVIRHGQRIPPYRETRLYVPAVLDKYREWQQSPAVESARHRIEYLPGTLLQSAVHVGQRP